MPAKSKREKGARQAKQYKVLRRVRVQVDRFSEYGIRRGDTALIAMTGEVRLGELGYFSANYDGGPAKQFKFVCEQDEGCKRFPSTYKPGGVCLRTYKQRCWGVHEGAAYGRVVAVEREGKAVETTLDLRAYDEREGPAKTRLEMSPWPEEKQEAATAEAEAETKPAEGGPTKEEKAEAEKTRRELLANLKQWGAERDAKNSELYPLGTGAMTNEYFAEYGVHNGDVARFTLDGDAQHGELALVSLYDYDDAYRYWFVAFLFVEGDHFCLREGDPSECYDDDRDPQKITIVGRVVRFERGGLPVRLKGLELRGLPYAEDVPLNTKGYDK
jgi:hypothetical protein